MNPLDVFFARWAAVAMPLPLLEVVNTPVDLDTLPDSWAGAYVQGDSRGDVTMGSNPWLEWQGQIVVGLLTKSGTGRAVLDAAADAVREHFQAYITPDGSLEFLSVIEPEDTEPEASGVWWRLAMRVTFVLQGRRAEPLVP